MDTARTTTRCPVYLHPAAASNPATVLSIQQATGQLVVINGTRTQLKPTTPADPFGPWDGGSAA
ncbi:hypothetical protein ACQKFS_02460 [Pseudomonas guineae]|uniref:hypothetical protein n=1 Tax=Pseudomonas guineae TaxID=425504 RepID=UPI003CFE5DBE